MSEIGFYLLPTGKLTKKTKKKKKKKLKHVYAGYLRSFYWNLANNADTFMGSDFYGRIVNDSNIPSENIQKYILATSDFTKGMQTDINYYKTGV